MRLIVLSMCVCVAACSQRPDSPTSPTAAAPAGEQMPARGGTNVPFAGSFTSVTEFAPPNPNARATLTGTASHVGRFVAIFTGVVDFATNSATGTFTLTASNGDQLSGTWEGVGEFVEPGVVRFTEDATIDAGTGRFVGTNGAFTIVRSETIANASGIGTIDGRINLFR